MESKLSRPFPSGKSISRLLVEVIETLPPKQLHIPLHPFHRRSNQEEAAVKMANDPRQMWEALQKNMAKVQQQGKKYVFQAKRRTYASDV